MSQLPTNVDGIRSDDDVFLCARFAGGRFDLHAIPFDVLPDLAAYRSLIIDVAKMLFKNRHNNRVRVPKGFEDSFQIGLVEVKGGHSAIAIGRRLPPQEQTALLQGSLGFPAYEEFDEARAYVDDLIRKVRSTGDVPEDFPPELASRFNPFGQSLQSDEYVELGYGGPNPVRYDTFIRKRIVLSREKTYENAVDTVFVLNGGLVDSGTIHVRDEFGGSFDFRPISGLEFDKAYSRPSKHVRLIGTGLYDQSERLRRLLDVRIVYVDDEPRQPFEERLDEIARTPAGWYEPGNPPPSRQAVQTMKAFVRIAIEDVEANAPYIYPLPDGGVAAEWSIGGWEASANVDIQGIAIELHAVDTESLDEIQLTIDASSADIAAQFAKFWQEVSGETGDADANS